MGYPYLQKRKLLVGVPEFKTHFFVKRVHSPGISDGNLAVRSQFQSCSAPYKQREAHLVLKLLYVMAYGGLSHIEHLGGAREVPAFRDSKHRLHFYIGHFLLLHYENLYVSKIISFAFIAKILYHIERRNAIHFSAAHTNT